MTHTAAAPRVTENWPARCSNMRSKVLGRGLDALISSTTATEAAEGRTAVAEGHSVVELDVSSIGPNPFQPRTRFDEAALKELAESIKATGIIQPLLVRRLEPG